MEEATTVVSERAQAVARYRAQTLSHYSDQQRAALRRLYEHVKAHPGTSGSNTCAKLLLGLYNGRRFPFDLTDLRALDAGLFAAAMIVIDMDARQTWCEVHVLLDAMYADGRSTGAEFEHWAFRLKWGKRVKKEHLPGLKESAC